jgi:hypothetical protein
LRYQTAVAGAKLLGTPGVGPATLHCGGQHLDCARGIANGGQEAKSDRELNGREIPRRCLAPISEPGRRDLSVGALEYDEGVGIVLGCSPAEG